MSNSIKGRIHSLSPYSLDPSLTLEGTAAEAKAVGEALKRKVSTEDICDDLTTKDPKKPLSANQGAVLKKALNELSGSFTELGKAVPEMKDQFDELSETVSNASKSLGELKKSSDGKIAPDGSVAMEKDLDLGGNKLLNVKKPENDTDGANKAYVDSRTFEAAVTLAKDKWASFTDSAPYTQTVELAEIQEKDRPHYGVVLSGTVEEKQAQKEAFGLVDDLTSSDGALVFTCLTEKPSIDFSVQIEVNR